MPGSCAFLMGQIQEHVMKDSDILCALSQSEAPRLPWLGFVSVLIGLAIMAATLAFAV